MKINYTGDIAGPCELDVPNALVKDLLTFAFNTTQWKQHAEIMQERVARFRKAALEQSKKTELK